MESRSAKFFADNIRKARENNNLTIEELAEKLDLSSRIVSYYEQGSKLPSIQNLLVISEVLGVTIDWLFRKN